MGERLSHKQEAAGSSPALPTRRIAQVAERLSDEEEAAGSTPAPPTRVTVAQPGRAAASYAGGCRFDACRGHLGRTATGAVPRLENGWARFGPWGFDSLSFRSL